jgi:exosome complex RNA-binding protein Csl4
MDCPNCGEEMELVEDDEWYCEECDEYFDE